MYACRESKERMGASPTYTFRSNIYWAGFIFGTGKDLDPTGLEESGVWIDPVIRIFVKVHKPRPRKKKDKLEKI